MASADLFDPGFLTEARSQGGGAEVAIDRPGDAVPNQGRTEVRKRSELEAGQLRIGQQLLLVNRTHPLDRLLFDDHQSLDDQVGPEAHLEHTSLEGDRDPHQPRGRQPRLLQAPCQSDRTLGLR